MTYEVVHVLLVEPSSIAGDSSAIFEPCTDSCGCNACNELVYSRRDAEGAENEFEYNYDDIGNRITSFDPGTNRTYTANELNQYTLITNLNSDAGLQTSEFQPQYDDDGNQTLIQTSTGIWTVIYNGENRPVLWERIASDSNTQNSNTQTLVSMSFDRMGRRVSYLETCGSTTNANKVFTYDGYLQIANSELTTQTSQLFIWDPTEPVATRPLVFYNSSAQAQYYTHDGNKNVSDLTDNFQNISAHYAYTPFGALLSSSGSSSPSNPFRFSSEYADDALGLVYYNYRHYNPEIGRWMQRDPAPIIDSPCRYAMCMNNLLLGFDLIGFWEATSESSSKARRVYRKSVGDTKESLAKEVGLDIVSFDVWAKEELGPTGNETVRPPGDDYCYYSVPNIWITADLLRGGSWLYDRAIVNMGGTMGVMIGTDFTRFGYKIVKADTFDNLLDAIKNSNGDLLGMTVYAHGNKSGYVGPNIGIDDFPGKTIQEKLVNYWSNNQMYLIRAIEEKKYRIRKVNMMQCYSMCTDGMFCHASKDGAFRSYLPDGNWFRFDYAQSLNWAQRWRSAAVESDGYEEYNVLGFDTAWISGLFSEREKE